MSPSIRRPLNSVRIAAAAAVFVTLGLASGCGPFGYLRKVSVDANRAVAEAEAAGAETLAPYEYWGAVTYLEQARALMAYSEYERSFDYGVRARQLAEEAKRKAERRESGKTVETLETPPAQQTAPQRPPAEVSPTQGPPTEEPSAETPPTEPPAADEPSAGGASQ